MSNRLGVPARKVEDDSWGTVNAYRFDVLQAWHVLHKLRTVHGDRSFRRLAQIGD